ncbi:unnamed protein product [Rangifer tarandus platyrhynchus]|uniref:Uncharacterized protein n=2 Tax=Rangifer tarandus platyrhynchus TaxID=3082113 RepID=A0AC59Y9U8_RANTA|nr:unnamed protein product [Rangifer tarandus platyrhynchus]
MRAKAAVLPDLLTLGLMAGYTDKGGGSPTDVGMGTDKALLGSLTQGNRPHLQYKSSSKSPYWSTRAPVVDNFAPLPKVLLQLQPSLFDSSSYSLVTSQPA